MKRSRLTRGGGLRPVSAKRAKINKIYSALRKKFLSDHADCQWWLMEHDLDESDVMCGIVVADCKFHGMVVPKSEDIHHMKHRGKYLLDTSTWMAVSRRGHDAIHADPKTSYEKGYMLNRN